MAAHEHVVGIDLGTSNSVVAIVEQETPIVIPNKGGYKTTPSVVAVSESGRQLVGHIAKRQAVTNAAHTIAGAKRIIGLRWDDDKVRTMRSQVAYSLIRSPDGRAMVCLRDEDLTIPEVGARVLQELKGVAEAYVGGPVHKAVITVPAHFSDGQRQATKDAGQIAGLEVIRIINEPTAAAIAYGFRRERDALVAVYDLGGGTFDVSILRLAGDVYEVVSTAGDPFLGGSDFDSRIVDWLVEQVDREYGVHVGEDKVAMQRLRDAAEKVRCELSFALEGVIDLPFLVARTDGQPVHVQATLTRTQLESLTRDLVDRSLAICRGALSDASVSSAELDEVILVGGMTRMPLIQGMVGEYFGREPCKGVHPDEVVALGAAIQGHALVGGARELLLLDVTPLSMGIKVAGGGVHELVAKNTTVPTSATHVFTTTRDDQRSVKIIVVQGEAGADTGHELLGEFVLGGLRSAPAGQIQVEVTFSISADGILSVSARDLESGREQGLTIRAERDDAVSAHQRPGQEEARPRRPVPSVPDEQLPAGVPRGPYLGPDDPDSASPGWNVPAGPAPGSAQAGAGIPATSERPAQARRTGAPPQPPQDFEVGLGLGGGPQQELATALEQLRTVFDRVGPTLDSTRFGRTTADAARETIRRAEVVGRSGSGDDLADMIAEVGHQLALLEALSARAGTG